MCSQGLSMHMCPRGHPPTPGDLPLLFRDVWVHVLVSCQVRRLFSTLLLSPSPGKGQGGSNLHTKSADLGRIVAFSQASILIHRSYRNHRLLLLGSPCTCCTVSDQKLTSLPDTAERGWDDYENLCCYSKTSVPTSTETKNSFQELHQRNHNGQTEWTCN